jgi:hypothetical protein
VTNTATVASAHELSRPSAARRLAGPPGLVFYLVTIGVILLGIDANTRQSLGLLLLTVPIWLSLAGVWSVRFLMALQVTRARMPAAHWARWLAIPLALGLVFALTRTDILIQGRFDLSRGALDEMGRDIEAGGSLQRGWVGLYDVGTAERTDNGFWFVIDDSGLGRWGLAYSPGGKPKQSDENFGGGLWTGASFQHIDGPWWTFQQGWD